MSIGAHEIERAIRSFGFTGEVVFTGSHIRDEATPESDQDLVLLFPTSIHLLFFLFYTKKIMSAWKNKIGMQHLSCIMISPLFLRLNIFYLEGKKIDGTRCISSFDRLFLAHMAHRVMIRAFGEAHFSDKKKEYWLKKSLINGLYMRALRRDELPKGMPLFSRKGAVEIAEKGAKVDAAWFEHELSPKDITKIVSWIKRQHTEAREMPASWRSRFLMLLFAFRYPRLWKLVILGPDRYITEHMMAAIEKEDAVAFDALKRDTLQVLIV